MAEVSETFSILTNLQRSVITSFFTHGAFFFFFFSLETLQGKMQSDVIAVSPEVGENTAEIARGWTLIIKSQ